MTKIFSPALAPRNLRSLAATLGIALLAGLLAVSPTHGEDPPDPDPDVHCSVNEETEDYALIVCDIATEENILTDDPAPSAIGDLTMCAMTSNPEDCEPFEEYPPPSAIGDLTMCAMTSNPEDCEPFEEYPPPNTISDLMAKLAETRGFVIAASVRDDTDKGVQPTCWAHGNVLFCNSVAALPSDEKEEGCCDSCTGGYCQGCAPAPHSTCKELDLELASCLRFGSVFLCHRPSDDVRLTATPPGNGGQSTPIPAMPEPAVPGASDDVPKDAVPPSMPSSDSTAGGASNN